MPPFKNRIGIRYKYLITKKFIKMDWDGSALWLCKCDCGNEVIIKGGSLQNGNTKSCGCYNRKAASERMLILNKKQIGKNAPMYIDGKYCGKATKEKLELKESIRKRDNYICQECGKTQKQNLIETKKKLSVHHIDEDDTNDDPNNLISYCYECHRKVHRKVRKDAIPLVQV